MGMFSEFVPEEGVRLVGVEAAGEGVETGRHSASLSAGRPGVLHGSLSYLLQNSDGQVAPAHSISFVSAFNTHKEISIPSVAE